MEGRGSWGVPGMCKDLARGEGDESQPRLQSVWPKQESKGVSSTR